MKISLKTEEYEKYKKAVTPYLKKEKNQKYLSIFLTIGVSIFFIIFAINPTLSTIAKLKKEVADNKALDQQLSQKIDNLSALGPAYEDIAGDIPFVEDAIPHKPEVPTLIAQIQELAGESGVSVSNIVVSPLNLVSSASTSSSSLTFTLSASGQYADFSRFLSYLVGMQRELSVDSIIITESDNATHFVAGTLKGTAYFKK